MNLLRFLISTLRRKKLFQKFNENSKEKVEDEDKMKETFLFKRIFSKKNSQKNFFDFFVFFSIFKIKFFVYEDYQKIVNFMF